MRFISFLKISSDQRATHLTKQKAFNYKTCFQGLLGFEVQNGGHSTSTTENSTDCYRLKNQKIQLIMLTSLVRLIALPWICFRGHK